jgi:hypothetical protein
MKYYGGLKMDLSSKPTATELFSCLACGDSRIKKILDLGSQPLANDFKETSDGNEIFPLKLNFCEYCSHLQLSHSVDRSYIFRNYLYVSGTTQTLKEYFLNFAKEATQEYYLGEGSTVIDIACNDGSQLDAFKSLGWTTVGIDPAENLFFESNKKHNILCDFLLEEHSKFLKADLIVAQNVLAHTDTPEIFLKICGEISNNVIIQTSQALMIERGEFDTVYHEHLSFFSEKSMMMLARRAGMKLIKTEVTPIHGTSFVFTLSKSGEEVSNPTSPTLEEVLRFAESAKNKLVDLDKVIADNRKEGRFLVGYGAAAKGMTVLNALEETLDLIIDDSPMKQNTYSPGKNIKISKIESLNIINKPLTILLLAWNFEDEIRRRISELKIEDVRYIKYFPEINIS